jgi:hypothetical protein
VTSSKPAIRYHDIRQNVAKIEDYLARGGGLDAETADDGAFTEGARVDQHFGCLFHQAVEG